MPDEPRFRPLEFQRRPVEEMRERAGALRDELTRRRSVRHFSDEPIPLDVVRDCIEAASKAPSGANKQPWTFVLVTDPALKKQIREGAEAEEREFYGGRAPDKWLADLAHLGTDENKPFLETAPALIVVFAQKRGATQEERNYYVAESVGIASGMLIAALHHAGLATLTHTPSPMKFLADILARPDYERPFLLLPVGYPAEGCEVPDIDKKPLSEILIER
jgi:nitroreductase